MVRNWIAIITLALAGSTQLSVADGNARDVMIRLQNLLRSDTNIASYSMKVETPDWERLMLFKSWDDQVEKRMFIRIIAPKKDNGTTFLKRESSLWMYLPKLERNIRIPPSMMLSAWMGSSFTYDDLMKTTSAVDDYTHTIIASDEETVTIESQPNPDAPVVWGKLVYVLTHEGIPISEDFYDEDGQRLRTLQFENVREMGGRKIPTIWVMYELDDSGKKTVLQLESVQFDPVIANSVFTHANMRRGGH